MNERLKIEFRQKQLFEDQDPTKPIVVQCNPDGTAEYVPGTVSTDWVNMTAHTEGLDDLDLDWQAVTDEDTEGTDTGSNYRKGVSLNLRFFAAAFDYIYNWLMVDPCQIMNAVEVRITDVECGKAYRVFELKLDNTKYAPGEEPCIVTMPLREGDDVIHAFKKTIIEDNWQGWFNRDGTSAKEHPTFAMIVERKPKFFLAIYVVLIYMVGMLSAGILVALNDGKRWIRRTLGFSYFCPGPLIRDIIQNGCDKYGFTFKTIFDDDPANKYRDLCFFWPASATYKNFEDFNSPSTKFIWDNRSVLSFTTFLNQLKKVFNAEWYVTPNSELIFQHKSYFDNQAPLHDFTAPGALQLYNLEYSFNGKKKAAYGNYSYLIDPQDTCTNEIKWRYNAIVDFDGPANNPMLEGNVTKTFDFATTAFHRDGTSEDFLEDAVKIARLVAAGAILVGLIQLYLSTGGFTAFIAAGAVAFGYGVVNDYVNDFFNNDRLNGIVRVAASEVNIPRLLLWDRTTPLDEAKVVKVTNPAINPVYNKTPVDYYDEHPTHDAPGYFGNDVLDVHNYPMYVDELFIGNLYDEFHEYDNPLRNPVINQDWSGSVDMCCEWLDILGVWENDYIKIGAVLTLEDRNGRKIKGRIDQIKPSYKDGKIYLQGKVLK